MLIENTCRKITGAPTAEKSCTDSAQRRLAYQDPSDINEECLTNCELESIPTKRIVADLR
jgi:hypothetical protein